MAKYKSVIVLVNIRGGHIPLNYLNIKQLENQVKSGQVRSTSSLAFSYVLSKYSSFINNVSYDHISRYEWKYPRDHKL